MARYKIPYPGLNESLKHLRVQVIHSLPYAVRNCPRNLKTAEQVFNYCKARYTFRNDPPGTELFQTVPTLLQSNEIGEPGHGDCDDATIFCLTVLLINGFDCGIVLTGRRKTIPTHIYAYANENGQRKILDLTNKNFNQERPYPFKQFIPFKISKNQLDMFLQLADSGNRKQTKRRRIVKLSPEQKQNGVYIPSKNVFVPIERFDKLPIKKARQTLLSEGYELEQLSEYLSGRAERKARKKEKAEFKTQKRVAKIEKKKAKTDIKKAKAEKKRATGEAKKIKAVAKQMKQRRKAEAEERGEESPFTKILNKSGEVIGNIMNREQEEPEEAEGEELETTEAEEIEGEEQTDESAELEEGEFNKTDILNGVIFLAGLFLEKTKKVA